VRLGAYIAYLALIIRRIDIDINGLLVELEEAIQMRLRLVILVVDLVNNRVIVNAGLLCHQVTALL